MQFKAIATASVLGYKVKQGEIVETNDKALIERFENSVTMIRLEEPKPKEEPEPKPKKKGGK